MYIFKSKSILCTMHSSSIRLLACKFNEPILKLSVLQCGCHVLVPFNHSWNLAASMLSKNASIFYWIGIAVSSKIVQLSFARSLHKLRLQRLAIFMRQRICDKLLKVQDTFIPHMTVGIYYTNTDQWRVQYEFYMTEEKLI